MGNANQHSLHSKVTLMSWLITLGIVFGDIGTSPLYVMKAIVHNRPISEDLILGGLSCVFWTLTLMTTVKYVFIMLKADNHGEGGILSLYAIIRRRFPLLVIPAMIGAAAMLADGMITPPISISSAIEGLRDNAMIRSAGIEVPVMYVVLVILMGLFFFQRFGTSVVGKFFGPIMFVWFLVLALAGMPYVFNNLYVLKALNPIYIYDLLINYPRGFWLLGAVFLCTTGAEALYSDLGHCGRRNIQYAWAFVKVCLLLNYFGQGAWLLERMRGGEVMLNGLNPFFEIIPASLNIAAVALATVAAVIASQALISGSYTLISEAILLNLWPKVQINYPSDSKGQLYIPSINYILLIGCMGVVLFFKESTAMEAAYGLAITVTMIVTTVLLAAYMVLTRVKRRFIIPTITTFLAICIAFLIANLEKFSHGGWVTLLLTLVFAAVMYIWFSARKIKNRYNEFVSIAQYLPRFKELSEDESIPKYATHLVYLTSADFTKDIESKIIYSIFNKSPKRADVYWFVHVHYVDAPYTQEYDVEILVPEKVIRVEFKLGFRVQPRINLFIRDVIRSLVEEQMVNPYSRYPSLQKHKIMGDFRFVVIQRILNYDFQLSTKDEMIMSGYAFLNMLSVSDEKAFGLDTSLVTVEKVPMIINPNVAQYKLVRRNVEYVENPHTRF